MKRAVVINPFNDKNEGVFRKIGDAFSVDDERAAFLVKRGLIKAFDVPNEAPKMARKKTVKK